MKFWQNINSNAYIKNIKEYNIFYNYIKIYKIKSKMARDKSIQPPLNIHLIFGCEAFIRYYCLETVLIRGHQTFTKMWWYFPPFFNADFLQLGKTLIFFIVIHFDFKLSVCFGSLFCCNVHFRLPWKPFALGIRFFHKFGDTCNHPSFHQQYGVHHCPAQRNNPKPLYCHLHASLTVNGMV